MTFNKSEQPKWSGVKEEDEINMKMKTPELEKKFNLNNDNNNKNDSKFKEVCTHGQKESQYLVQSNSLVGSVQGTSQNLNTREEDKVASGKQDMQKIVSNSSKIQVGNKELKLDLQTVCVSSKSNKSTIGPDSSSSVECNRCNCKSKATKGNVHVLVTSSPLVDAIEEWRRSIESNNYHAEQIKNECSSRVVQLHEEEKEELLEIPLEKEKYVKEEAKEQNGEEQQGQHHTVQLSSLQTLRLIEPAAPLLELLSPLSDRETIISSDTVPTTKLEEMAHAVDTGAHRTRVEERSFNDASIHKDRHKTSQVKNDSNRSNDKDAKSTQLVFSPIHAIESNSLLTTTGTNMWSCMSAMNGDDSLSATSMPIFYSSNSITAHFITPQGLCFDSESNANVHSKHDNGVEASKNNDEYSGDDDETIALDKRDEESTYSRLFSSEASEDVMRTLTRGLALGGFDLSTIISHELRTALTSGANCTSGNEKLVVTELKTNSNGESLTLQRRYGINTCNRQHQCYKEQIPLQVQEHHVPEDEHELWEHEETPPIQCEEHSGDKEKVCDHDGACDSCGYLLEANEGLSNQPVELESIPTTTSSSLLSSCHTIQSVNNERTHTSSLPHVQRHGECTRHTYSPSIISNPPVVIVTAAHTPPTSASVLRNCRPQPLSPVQLSVAQRHVPYWNRGPHYHLYLHRFGNITPSPHTVNTTINTTTTSDCLHKNNSGDDVNDEPPENLQIERNTGQEVCATLPREHSDHHEDYTHANSNSNNHNSSDDHYGLEESPLPMSACVLASSAASTPFFLPRRHSSSPIHPHLRSHFALSSLTPHYRTESQLTVREAPVTIHECWAPEYPALELPLIQECQKECETATNGTASTHAINNDNNIKCSETENSAPSSCVEHHLTLASTKNESSSRTPLDHVEKEQIEAMKAVKHVGNENNNNTEINNSKLENCNNDEESVKVSECENNDKYEQTQKDCDVDDETSTIIPDDSNELAAELAESRDCIRMELPITVSITNDEEPSSSTITQDAATITSTTTTTSRATTTRTTTTTTTTTRSVTSITATCANISRTISGIAPNGNNISDSTITISNNNYNNDESNTNDNNNTNTNINNNNNNTTTTNTSRSASGNNVNSVITNRSLTALIGFAHPHRRRQNEFHSLLNGSYTAITNSSSSNNTTSTTFTASTSLSSNNSNVGVEHDYYPGPHTRRAVASSASLLLSSTSTAMQRSSANAYVSGSSLPSSLIGENFLSSLIGTEIGPNAVLVSSSRCGIPQITTVPAFDGAHLATSPTQVTEETPLQQFPSLLEEHQQPECRCNSQHHMPCMARSTRNSYTRRHENNAPIITFPFYDVHEEQSECTHYPLEHMSEELREAPEKIECKDNNNINAIDAESNNIATNTKTSSESIEGVSKKHVLQDDVVDVVDDDDDDDDDDKESCTEMHHRHTLLEQNDVEGKMFHSEYKSTNFQVISGNSHKETCNTNNIVELLAQPSCNTNGTPTIEQKIDLDAKECTPIAQTTLVDVIDRSKSECHGLFHDSNNVGEEVVALTASTTEPLHNTSTCIHNSREKNTQNTSIMKKEAAASLVDVNAHSSITSFDGTAEEEEVV